MAQTPSQWQHEELLSALREQAKQLGSSGMLNRLPLMSRMEIDYLPPHRKTAPGEYVTAYRTLRTAYHARAWR